MERPGLGEVIVMEKNHKTTVSIQSHHHDWIADEPTSIEGGEDLGPSPYELLLSALGACTTITMRMYIQRTGWPVEHIQVKLWHAREQSGESGGAKANPPKQLIHRQILVKGDLSQDQLDKLMEIANKCPVHRTLMGEIETPTNLERV